MPQNIIIFEAEDVIVGVPDKYQGHDIIVEKKVLDVSLPFARPVINFWAYYFDKDQNKVAVTTFRPRMEIWVGYREGEEDFDLSYWDDTADSKVNMPHTKVNNKHKQVYDGYGHVERTDWPGDPNVGWG